MTSVYFVRHAQPDYKWPYDRTRPLTQDGLLDTKEVTKILKDKKIDYIISSPYKRSIDTIRDLADTLHMNIDTNENFRERKAGSHGNNNPMFQKRWADFSFKEEGGECLADVQARNITALTDTLSKHTDGNIVIATHGTALSTILNYYDNSFHCDSFFRIINYMPYIIRLDFEGKLYLSKEELLIIEKKFT